MNQKGMGLVEVLIAAGILGGLSLIIMELSSNSQKSVSTLEASSDILTVVQGIQGVLSNPVNCTETFKNKIATNETNAVAQLKDISSGMFKDNFKTVSADPSMVYGQRRLKIKSYSLSDATSDVSVAALRTTHLVIGFDKGNSALNKNVSKRIPLKVEIDGSGRILSCVALSHNSDNIWMYSSNNTDIYYNSGKVGVGVISPVYDFEVQKSMVGLTNTTAAFIGGTDISYGNSGIYVLQKDGSSLSSNGTHLLNVVQNNVSKLTVTGAGNVGIGDANPTAKLDVAGEAKIGNTGLPCNAGTAGAMRYNSGTIQFCNGTGWAGLAGNPITSVIVNVCSGTHLLVLDSCIPANCLAGYISSNVFITYMEQQSGVPPLYRSRSARICVK